MSFRIPKKTAGGPPPPQRQPPGISLPTSSTSGAGNAKTFQPIGTCPVQTNIFRVDITKMPAKLVRLFIETTLCGGKVDIKLNDGLQAVSGGVNSNHRRLAQQAIFRKVFERHPEIFGTDIMAYAYDCAATIYTIDGTFKGGKEFLKEKLEKKDFTEKEWSTVARILRSKNAYFKIVLSATGFVYTDGPEALSDQNRQELTRLIEIVSSEVLNTPDNLQLGNQTFPFRQPPVNNPDATSEIRSGFDKSARLVEGSGGKNTEIVISIDTKLSPFYKPSSVLQFICGKYQEYKNPAAAGPSSGPGSGYPRRGNFPSSSRRPDDRRGDQGGHRGREHEHRRDERQDAHGRRDRSRSPRDRQQTDWSFDEVAELQNAFKSGREARLFNGIEEALKGLFVEPIHLPKDSNREALIKKLSASNAKNTFFEMKKEDGEMVETSVYDYYVKQYNFALKFPELPLIVSGRLKRATLFPMELLQIVPGQRIKLQKMNANVQASMTGQNATLPKEHVHRIGQILREALKVDRNPHLEKFGIRLAKEPIQMPAMILSPAQMIFGSRIICAPPSGSVQFKPRDGTKFVKPAKIQNVAVVLFDGAGLNLEVFCSRLHTTCEKNGLQMTKPARDWIKMQLSSNDTARLKVEMEKFRQNNVTIIIGITPEKKPDVHDTLKYFEAGLGLQTLQIHINTAECFTKEQGGAQTVANVMRKLNLKCGGINFLVEVPQSYAGKVVCSNATFIQKKLFEKTQFIGFEMTHGSARTSFDRSNETFDGEPTVVGCSYSLKSATELGGFNFLQEQNEYKLKNLETRFSICLDLYKKSAGSLPETIVVYRTGAGDGDFKRVEEEILEMRKAAQKIEARYQPKLLVVVVNKTSHTRIFPKEIQGHKAFDQNVKSGTCLDGQITAFGREEFILVSQSPLIGTVRPVKFSIVANDASWSKNEIIHLTYFLAYGHQVSYQPPAIPHVLYAAENLAKRGRNNFITHKKLGEFAESIKSVLAEHRDLDDDSKKKEFEIALVDNVTEAMNKMAVKNKNFWA